MFETLEKSVLAKDPPAIVQTLSTWSEADREAARTPLAILLFAYGMDDRPFVQLLDVSTRADDPQVRKKRKRDRIVPMSRRDRTYDYDLSYIAWLACYGIAPESFCRRFPSTPDYEAESAQIMADRQPQWLQSWISELTKFDEEGYSSGIHASFWARLFHHGLIQTVDDRWVKHFFAQQLPQAFQSAREATENVLRNVAVARETLFDLPNQPYQLFSAKDWGPVAQWLVAEGLLEHKALLSMLTETLHQPLNQTERNGCVIIAKEIVKPKAKCKPEVIEELQSTWIGLLSDPQPVVAGFGLEQLITLKKHGRLDAQRAVDKIPAIFQLKPKGQAIKAVRLLSQIGSDQDQRLSAIDSLCLALPHSNKDVQAAAIDAIAELLQSDDSSVFNTIQSYEDVVAATLKKPLKELLTLISSESPTQASNDSIPSDEPLSSITDLRERVAALDPKVAERFCVVTAVESASKNQWESFDPWQMTDLNVTRIREPIEPIATVDELIEMTSQAVEQCECGDTPDRIVDAIVRLCRERDDHFSARTDSMRSRACVHISDRPDRGIVGGWNGNAFSELICAWLDVEPEDEDDGFSFPEHYPMGVFLRKVAERIRRRTEYPLLSTPTHRGGWISATIWVDRLRHLDSEQIDFLEDDLVRSMLRIAPDGRKEAWISASNSENSLSQRFLKLAQFVLDLETPNESLALDDSWPLPVWIVAIRARDPMVDLSNYLPESEREKISDEVWELPDVIQPSNFQFSVLSAESTGYQVRLVNTDPMPQVDGEKPLNEMQLLSQMLEEASNPLDFQAIARQFAGSQGRQQRDAGFYTARLNFIDADPQPSYVYPNLATHWPAKLTWYWAAAAGALSQRIDSGPSVWEPYDQYLLPLLELDQCVETMAARALWVATASKDSNAKSMAIEVWISIIADDRCDVGMMVCTWHEIFRGGWMKVNRIAEVFAEVAVVSPQHALLIALMIESFLVDCDSLPRDTAKLLEILNECNEWLGRKLADSVASKLQGIKSGKARTAAKALLAREQTSDGQLHAAIVSALEARVTCAERHSIS